MEMLVEFMLKYPQISSVLMVVGLLRAVFKPLQLVAQAYVDATPDKADNEKLEKLMDSKLFKTIAWVLNYTASIKIPSK